MSLHHQPRRARRACAIFCLAGLGVAIAALPASAHVTVSADDSSKGADDSVLTFRVPNEMDNATSVKLDVKFPTATPLAEVDPEPVAGYTITTKTVTFNPPLATDDGTIKSGVGEVTWTATSPSAGIPIGDFNAFRVLVGPLPTTVDELAFPAVQTYSNGQVVSWIQPTTDPANPPEHPAAVLTLTAGTDDSSPASATPDTASPAASSPAASASAAVSAAPGAAAPTVQAAPASDLSRYATTSQANTGKTLGIVGIIVGTLGLLAGGAGLARGRSRG